MQVIDKRVIERQIRKGKLDAAAYQRSLMGLPDVSDRVAKESDLEPVRREPSPVASPAVSSEPRAAAAPSEADATDGDDEDDVDDDEDDDDDDDDVEGDESPDAPAP